jgi:hypothetical protein
MFATVWDGSNSDNLTADGAVLSGAPMGTFFTRDKESTQPYTVSFADEVRMTEPDNDKRIGFPFTITAKGISANYMRFHYSTTDDPVDFDLKIFFRFRTMNGGTFTVVS